MRAWIPSLTMMLVSLISYVDRNTLAILSPTILRETGLSVEQYGWVISAFSFSYMIGNPVWGMVLDRLGLRRGMTAAVSFWTLASVSHAFAGGFASFAAARAALGFGEGATFPGGLRAAVQSLPVEKRGRGIAVSYSGGSLGAVLAPLIVTPVALWWGWRGAFWFTGLIGAGWLVLWMFVSRRPDIRNATVDKAAGDPLRASDRRLWAFMLAYALGASPLAFVLYQSAIYLNRSLGASQAQIGALLWIPPLGWEIGYFAWGWVTDRMLAARANKIPAYGALLAALAVLSLPLAVVPSAGTLVPVMAMLAFAMFIAAGFVIVTMSYATHAFSAANAGLIAGLGAGSWGAAVALVMPRFGRLFDAQRYDEAFLLAALIPSAGTLLWWLAAGGSGQQRGISANG